MALVLPRSKMWSAPNKMKVLLNFFLIIFLPNQMVEAAELLQIHFAPPPTPDPQVQVQV